MTQQVNFQPAFGMSNSHIQTIFGRIVSLLQHKNDLNFEEKILNLEDGDFLELVWHPKKQIKDTPIVIIFPGLGGNLKEGPQYKELLEKISMSGWRGLFVHFRGCGQMKSKTPKIYHNADISQIEAVINYLKKQEPNTTIAAVGVSSGGGLLAKWLAESKNASHIKTNILISPAFDIGAISLQTNWYIKYYLYYFLKPYRTRLVAKFSELNDKRVDLNLLKNANTMFELDTALCQIYGYSSAQEYYDHAKPNFSLIKTKLTIIHDQNDPLVPADSIPLKEINHNQNINLYLTQAGGHGGFIERGTILSPFNFWIGTAVVDLLKEDLPLGALKKRREITNQTSGFFRQKIKQNIYDLSYLLMFSSIIYATVGSKSYGHSVCILLVLLLSLKKSCDLVSNVYNYENAMSTEINSPKIQKYF